MGRVMLIGAVAVLVCLAVLTLCAGPAYCADPVRKLLRGISNVAACPLELLNTQGDRHQEKNDMKALINTTFNRIFRVFKRAGVGVYEVATFLFPMPANYDPIMNDPEFLIGVNRSLGPDLNI